MRTTLTTAAIIAALTLAALYGTAAAMRSAMHSGAVAAHRMEDEQVRCSDLTTFDPTTCATRGTTR
jgi:Spy/CpxP family protein refolding chaperone